MPRFEKCRPGKYLFLLKILSTCSVKLNTAKILLYCTVLCECMMKGWGWVVCLPHSLNQGILPFD